MTRSKFKVRFLEISGNFLKYFLSAAAAAKLPQ